MAQQHQRPAASQKRADGRRPGTWGSARPTGADDGPLVGGRKASARDGRRDADPHARRDARAEPGRGALRDADGYPGRDADLEAGPDAHPETPARPIYLSMLSL